MISGFLRRKDKKIVDGQGREILLKGWGLGNWMLQEGYMWMCSNPRFDRPRRIEQVVEELTGKNFSQWFWFQFRQNYIRREDIHAMAQLGYNSVRIPFNYRLFMEDGPELRWKPEGFWLLDRCLDWCEAEGIYAFLDLHGAPGGQTGSNIDDSIDNVPRLFIDQDSYDKAIALWKKLAARYAGREVVGGYDLLNEPVIPPYAGNGDFDYLIPKLKQFYKDVIKVIREVDPDHLLSLEGPHWSTDVSIFDCDYDENMVIHFHRYAEPPEITCLKKYIEVADRQGLPLWLGETGENVNEWFGALYPLAESLGIGYNVWPWKKMGKTNSPCGIKPPQGWDEVLSYIEGGPHPGYERSREIFCEYLNNILYENCIHYPEITCHVMRRPPFSIMAVDFDCLPQEKAFILGDNEKPQGYREASGMEVIERFPRPERRFGFDSGWERYGLRLKAGETVEYSFDPALLKRPEVRIELEYEAEKEAALEISCVSSNIYEACSENGETDTEASIIKEVSQGNGKLEAILNWEKDPAASGLGTERIKVNCIRGSVVFVRISFDPT